MPHRLVLCEWEILGFNNTKHLGRNGLLWVIVHYLVGWSAQQDLSSLTRMRSWRTYLGGFFSGREDWWILNIVNV